MVEFNPLKNPGSIVPAGDGDDILVGKVRALAGNLFFQDPIANGGAQLSLSQLTAGTTIPIDPPSSGLDNTGGEMSVFSPTRVGFSAGTAKMIEPLSGGGFVEHTTSWASQDKLATGLAVGGAYWVVTDPGFTGTAIIVERFIIPTDRVEVLLGYSINRAGAITQVRDAPFVWRNGERLTREKEQVGPGVGNKGTRKASGQIDEKPGTLTASNTLIEMLGEGLSFQGGGFYNPNGAVAGGVATTIFDTIKPDGAEFNVGVTVFPKTYNNSGSETALTGVQAVVHQVAVLPGGLTVVQLGTTAYSSFIEATASIEFERERNPLWSIALNIGVRLGYVVMAAGATKWAPNQAKIIDADGTASIADIDTYKQTTQDHSTGIFIGGALSVNGGDPAELDISDGECWVVDSHSGPNSISTPESWTGLVGLTITNLATQNSTFVALDFPAGVPTLVQQATDFTLIQRRDLIVLGRVLHIDNVTITGFVPTVCPSYNVLLTTSDFLVSFGPFQLTGNVYGSTGANLIPQKTAGSSFKLGANFGPTSAERKDPNRTSDDADIGLTFGYVRRDPGQPDGFSIDIPLTSFNPDIYDLGDGTTPAVPNNQWTFQTLFFFPQVNTHRFHLGQDTYSSKQDAIDAITAEPITVDPFLDTAVRRGWLVVKKGTTDLTNTNNAVFLEASDIAFGGGGGGPTTLDSLADVTAPTPSDGDVLSFDGVDWKNLRSPVTYIFQSNQNVAAGTNALLELTTQSEFIPIKVDIRIKTVDIVDLVIDINNGGATLVDGTKPTITAAAKTGTANLLSPNLAIGQVLTVDIDSGGSAWAGLTVEVTGYTIPN